MAEGQSKNLKAVRQCVQCLQSYKEEENADDSCKFHLLGQWGRNYQCCKTNSSGCCSQKHRSQHHTDWKYGKFLEVVRSIDNTRSNSTQWAKIETQDLEQNATIYASIGYISGAAPQWKRHLYILLNSYWNFRTFSIKNMENIQNVTNVLLKTTDSDQLNSNRAPIVEIIDDKTKAVIKAEWSFNEKTNSIDGVYLSIQTQTSSKSESVLVKFSTDENALRLDGIETISKGGFTEYKPSVSYHELIKKQGVHTEGVEFEHNYDRKQVEKQRKNIKTKYFGPLAPKMSITQKKFLSNDNGFSYKGDWFLLELQFMNKTVDSDFVFTTIEGIYQLVGDTNWSQLNEDESVIKLRKYKPEGSFYLNETESIPFNLNKGRGTTQLIQLEIFVPFEFNQQPKPSQRWDSRSFLARHRPINFKFKFQDIDDQSIIFETQFITHLYARSASKEAVLSMTLDDCINGRIKCAIELKGLQRRNAVESTADEKEEKESKDMRWSNFETLKLDGGGTYYEYDISTIRSMVYKAMKKKESIIKFDAPRLEYNAYGYIDKVCQRLYGIKLVLTAKSCRKTGFYVLPMYGNIYDVEEREPVIVSDDEENKYFQLEENALGAFKMDEIVYKYYNVDNSRKILIQKCIEREVELKDFVTEPEVDDGKESENEKSLRDKIQQQAAMITDLKKQLQPSSGGGAATETNTDAVSQWATELANKFEEIAQIFRAYPGK